MAVREARCSPQRAQDGPPSASLTAVSGLPPPAPAAPGPRCPPLALSAEARLRPDPARGPGKTLGVGCASSRRTGCRPRPRPEAADPRSPEGGAGRPQPPPGRSQGVSCAVGVGPRRKPGAALTPSGEGAGAPTSLLVLRAGRPPPSEADGRTAAGSRAESPGRRGSGGRGGLPSRLSWPRHEEGSHLTAGAELAPPPRAPGTTRPPPRGMKGDGGALWGLMWKYCVSVRTLRSGEQAASEGQVCARAVGTEGPGRPGASPGRLLCPGRANARGRSRAPRPLRKPRAVYGLRQRGPRGAAAALCGLRAGRAPTFYGGAAWGRWLPGHPEGFAARDGQLGWEPWVCPKPTLGTPRTRWPLPLSGTRPLCGAPEGMSAPPCARERAAGVSLHVGWDRSPGPAGGLNQHMGGGAERGVSAGQTAHSFPLASSAAVRGAHSPGRAAPSGKVRSVCAAGGPGSAPGGSLVSAPPLGGHGPGRQCAVCPGRVAMVLDS
ncbi:spidroin-2-like [Perognathus longimembris pacificus]|uniref:spidroin-2-like n=1 Tax=Perognathus longimembris pacificus TaxID=214514 RepID=UPI002018BF29|nr:spidroin-2-like [Perognathus longimembris pacificus]